jgi:hypothetical protein
MTFFLKKPEENDMSHAYILLQIVSVTCAGICLLISREFPIVSVLALALLGVSVFLAGYSHHKLVSILLIGLFTSLILSLRFDFLPWGDPWFEYGMIRQILAHQSLDSSVYPAQLPIIHVIITVITQLSGLNPLDLFKYTIPPLSIIGLYGIFSLTKKISSSVDTAFFAGLLLLCGTRYIHWTTQGVRETVGIALFILALYVSLTAIQSQKKTYIAISLLLILGLVLTHHLSAMIFLIVWIVVSLVFLYLMCEEEKAFTSGVYGLIIAVTSIVIIEGWWMERHVYEFSEFNRLLNTIYFSEYGGCLFIFTLVFLYLLPSRVPVILIIARLNIARILGYKKILYALLILVTLVGGCVVWNYFLGESSVILNYPAPMFFNGLCMIVFSLVGIYYFLEIKKFYIIVWLAVLSLIMVLSMRGVIAFVDPLRFLEFLYVPLSIVAAFGVAHSAKLPGLEKMLPILLALFVITSVATSFPPSVFFGNSVEPNHPLYDSREWVIQHHLSEIAGISWLRSYEKTGVIDTDVYVAYAARALLEVDARTVQSDYPFIRDFGYPQKTDTTIQQHTILILSRMKNYMEFGIQWLKKKAPLTEEEIQKINRETDLLYTNGDVKVFNYYSNTSSEHYSFYLGSYGYPPPE